MSDVLTVLISAKTLVLDQLLAPLEIIKSSIAVDIAEIGTGSPDGSINVTITCPRPDHYSATMVIKSGQVTYTGTGVANASSVKPATFNASYRLLLSLPSLDDLINGGPTTCSWHNTPAGIVAVVYGSDGTSALMHLFNCPADKSLGNTAVPVVWCV